VGRERWWRAAHERTLLDDETMRQAPADAETYLRAVAATYADTVQRWLAESQVLPEQWRSSHTLSDWKLRLTPAEASRLCTEMFALVDSYRQHSAPDAPEDAELVSLQVLLMPFVRRADEG
jgi:hypothetical protein